MVEKIAYLNELRKLMESEVLNSKAMEEIEERIRRTCDAIEDEFGIMR